MKIGVLSDTHDKLGPVRVAVQYFQAKRIRTLIHCGDWTKPATLAAIADMAAAANMELYGVYGNNDSSDELKAANRELAKPVKFAEGSVLELSLGGRLIAAYHGHHRPTLNRLTKARKYQVIMLGHSHKFRNEMVAGTLIMNPGSTAYAYPRSTTDLSSVAVYDTASNAARAVYLATLR